jgi:Tol biopolymer transport system component
MVDYLSGLRRREMRTRRTLTALVLGLAVLGWALPAVALPAAASDRPQNGQITFGRFDPELGDFSIWAANPDGTHQRRLTHVPSFFSDWSPDGRRIAFDFADDTGSQIATMEPNGRNMRQLTHGRGLHDSPKWSPDGRWIIFNASTQLPGEPGFHTDLWIMRADGSHKRQLTRGAFDVEPVFSPDGRRIAFGHITHDDQIPDIAIDVVNTDGTHRRQVVPSTFGLEHPDWSPDGRWITFNIAPELPNGAVMAVRPNGTGLRVVRDSDDRFEVYKPVWSPDGRKFLVVCYDVRAQIEKLCVMNADGRNLRVIVATPDFVNFPAWGSHPPKH